MRVAMVSSLRRLTASLFKPVERKLLLWLSSLKVAAHARLYSALGSGSDRYLFSDLPELIRCFLSLGVELDVAGPRERSASSGFFYWSRRCPLWVKSGNCALFRDVRSRPESGN
jgi:hypothetical protein